MRAVPAPAPRLRACMFVCESTGRAHWLHGGPAGLVAVTGPSRSCVVQMREGCCAERRAGCRCRLPGFLGRPPEQSNTAVMAPQGAPARILPPLGITVPLTAPAIHTAGVPSVSDVRLASRGRGAQLTQPSRTRDEGIAFPAINISVRCGTELAAVLEPKDSEIQSTVITSRNEKLERSGRTSPWSVELDTVGW